MGNLNNLNIQTTLAKVQFHCLDVVQIPIQRGHARAELRENARLSLAELVVHASSVTSRPGSVDSAYGFPDSRRHLLSRSPQAFLCPLNHTPGQPGPVSDHSSLVRRSLRQSLCLLSQLEDRAHRGPRRLMKLVGLGRSGCSCPAIFNKKGFGWTKHRLPKSWPARAILEEDRTRYLVEWEPVSSGAECERKWEPKHHANAALVADWEGRKRARPQRKSNFEQEDASIMESGQQGHGHNHTGTESDGRSQQTATRPLSPVEHGADSEVVQHNSADNDRLMNTQLSGDLGNYVVSIPLEITSAAFSGVSNIPSAKASVGFAHMYNGHGVKRSDASSSMMANHTEQGCEPPHAKASAIWPEPVRDNHRCEITQARDDTSAIGPNKFQPKPTKSTSSKAQHIEKSASSLTTGILVRLTPRLVNW
ncbi:hypothetical protein Q7P37_009929 [Cladosporium fusiforme]